MDDSAPKLKPKEKAAVESYTEYEDRLIEYLTSPSTINVHSSEIEIGKYHQVICAINYPRLVDPGWLTRLIEMNLDFDLSIHISPYKIDTTIKLLENEIKKQKTDLYALETEGKIVPQALIQQHQDTMALLQLIQEGTEKMFDMSLYIDAKAYNKEDLERISKQIRDTMNSIMIIPKIPSYQMYQGLRSTLPIGIDQIHVTRNITSSAAAACFPFAITSLEQHATGILIGFNEYNSIPIIIDPFQLSNPNILVLGTSGGGKSYGIKLILMREFMEGVSINIIDPQAEYTDLIRTFNGEVIRIAPESDSIINPFDMMDQTFDEKKLSLFPLPSGGAHGAAKGDPRRDHRQDIRGEGHNQGSQVLEQAASASGGPLQRGAAAHQVPEGDHLRPSHGHRQQAQKLRVRADEVPQPAHQDQPHQQDDKLRHQGRP
jgi:hypothetical protein